MVRTVALLIGGLVLVCVGVATLDPFESSPALAGRESATTADPPPVPDPAEAAAPRSAGRAREAHPEHSSFEPATVTFVDATARDAAAVDPVATRRDGALQLPADPARMGWWTGGSRAGAPYGSVVLAGHLDSVEFGIGFSALMAGLDVGEQVVLSDDDQTMGYVVTSRYLQPRASAAGLAALFSDRSEPRLVLLTCGGSYDHAVGAYSDNLVVVARPTDLPRRKGHAR
ncbi:MAG: class F sortase [Nocardioides sp.]|nr:class F sortase [Nocardioides sp.]